MLTITEANRRALRCLRCGCTGRLIMPALVEQTAIYRFRAAGDEVSFVCRLREIEDCTEADARVTYAHLARLDGTCHLCGTVLPDDTVCDCPGCGSLNMHWYSAQRPG